jgi:hypothetical protein
MPPLYRRSTSKEFLRFCIVLVCASQVLAQHAPSRVAGGAHYPAPPISHVPISRPTTLPAPLFRAPIYAPRLISPPSAGRLGTPALHIPWHPIRRFPPVLFIYGFPLFAAPWGFNSCWSAACDFFWPWTFDYTSVYASGSTNFASPMYEAPAYDYGLESPSLPQLFLKDGSILNVTDYWLVDDQLHFTMIEDDGAKPQEHVIPYELLDLQKTVDVNTRRGFRFVLRDEPVEQYMRDHPEGPPPPLAPTPR